MNISPLKELIRKIADFGEYKYQTPLKWHDTCPVRARFLGGSLVIPPNPCSCVRRNGLAVPRLENRQFCNEIFTFPYGSMGFINRPSRVRVLNQT